MKTIIAGSRHIDDYQALKETMSKVGWEITEVVSGGCRGVDQMGEEWAEENGIPVKTFVADWATYGRIAGELRNRRMAEYADALVILWDGKSPGASCMMREASKAGIRIHNTIYGVDMHDMEAAEQAILEYYWAGRGRLVYLNGHWGWEEADAEAPKVVPSAIDSLIARGMMEEREIKVLLTRRRTLTRANQPAGRSDPAPPARPPAR